MHEKSPTGVGKIFAAQPKKSWLIFAVFFVSVRKIENRFKHDAVDFRNGFFSPSPKKQHQQQQPYLVWLCVCVCVCLCGHFRVCLCSCVVSRWKRVEKTTTININDSLFFSLLGVKFLNVRNCVVTRMKKKKKRTVRVVVTDFEKSFDFNTFWKMRVRRNSLFFFVLGKNICTWGLKKRFFFYCKRGRRRASISLSQNTHN